MPVEWYSDNLYQSVLHNILLLATDWYLSVQSMSVNPLQKYDYQL